MWETLKHNLFQLLVGIDQLLNVIIFMFIGHKAWCDETLSAHCWRIRLTHGRKWPSWIVDHIIFWEKDHCKTAYESEVNGMHLHPSERK